MTAPPVGHRGSVQSACDALGVDCALGLTSGDAARRLADIGPNALLESHGNTAWTVLRGQFAVVMMLVLLAAAAISVLLGDVTDALAILVIVALNAALGFHQEDRAERAMNALKQLAVPLVKIRRGGDVQAPSSQVLVPGDILILEAGDIVPADARLLPSPSLRVQESALTGESVPVEKDADADFDADAPIAERRCMVYMGTAVASGRAEAVVTATGMRTELGHIASALQTVQAQPTPLQVRLEQLARWLAVAALVIVALVALLGLARGEDPRTMFLTAVSLAVAAVPEGLPAVVTISLAFGAQRMLRRRALIRKLLAVESLGSITTICSALPCSGARRVPAAQLRPVLGRRSREIAATPDAIVTLCNVPAYLATRYWRKAAGTALNGNEETNSCGYSIALLENGIARSWSVSRCWPRSSDLPCRRQHWPRRCAPARQRRCRETRPSMTTSIYSATTSWSRAPSTATLSPRHRP